MFGEDFKKFVVENKLVTFAASWAVAVGATSLIHSTVGDIFLPSVYLVIVFLLKQLGHEYQETSGYLSVFEKANKVNIGNFLKEFISFIITMTLLYNFIIFIGNNWVDDNGKYKQDNMSTTKDQSVPNFAPYSGV